MSAVLRYRCGKCATVTLLHQIVFSVTHRSVKEYLDVCCRDSDCDHEWVELPNALRVAFCGASGTGKTTLARRVAEHFDLPVNPVGSRSVAASMGFLSPYDVDRAGRRGEFQRRLLAEKTAWEATRESFVTDRSTLDNVVYASLHDVSVVDDEMVAVMARGLARYTHLIYCPVNVFRSDEPDAARTASAVYHELFDAFLFGMIDRYARSVKLYILGASALDERERVVFDFLKGGI